MLVLRFIYFFFDYYNMGIVWIFIPYCLLAYYIFNIFKSLPYLLLILQIGIISKNTSISMMHHVNVKRVKICLFLLLRKYCRQINLRFWSHGCEAWFSSSVFKLYFSSSSIFLFESQMTVYMFTYMIIKIFQPHGMTR